MSFVQKNLLDRRDVLRGTLGTGAAMLPLLGRPSGARAQGSHPTRLVVWFTPQEPIDKAHWTPGAGFKLHNVMSSLEPHKSKLLMLGDLKMAAGEYDRKKGHNLIGSILTGRDLSYYGENYQFYGGGISVDQYIAQKLKTKPLVVGVSEASYKNSYGTYRMTYTAKDQPVHPQGDPRKAFDGLFANFTKPPEVVDNLHAKKKSVLDALAKHLGTVRSRLAPGDYLKVERHLEQVRALEAKLNDTSGQGTMVTCEKRPPAGGLDPKANSDIPEVTRAQIDVTVQALACNLTRVATIQVGSSGGFATPNWSAEGLSTSKYDHDIAHEYPDAGVVALREKLEAYHYRQFAYLLTQMDSVPEGNGTMLDHSVVFWVKSMSHNHHHSPMVLMLAGGANGQLKGGRYKSFPGGPTENVLANVVNLMGLPDKTFGDPRYCKGAFDLS